MDIPVSCDGGEKGATMILKVRRRRGEPSIVICEEKEKDALVSCK